MFSMRHGLCARTKFPPESKSAILAERLKSISMTTPIPDTPQAGSLEGDPSTPMPSKSRIQGSGEVANLIRSTNWSATPLGEIETWSETLLATVNILLLSPFSFAIYWGRGLTLLYNDAYRPFLGEKHPQALGATGPMVWRETWDVVGPSIQAALDEGAAMTAREAYIPILNDGKLQDRWWTYSFYPVYEGDGIAGVANPASEDTAAVLARKAALQERGQVLECSSRRQYSSHCYRVRIMSSPCRICFIGGW